jgi:aquaporin Z
MFTRRKVAALVAEFLGTGVLALLFLSVKTSSIGVPLFVAMAAGLAVVLMTFIFAEVTEGHFNPALTFALATARRIAPVKAVLYIAAQMLGAWAAYGVFTYLVSSSLPDAKPKSDWQSFTTEAVGTGIFALGWAAVAYQKFSVPVRASVSGLAYMLGIVAVSETALGLLNPAVALAGRSLSLHSYILGPVVGAFVAVNLYRFLFAEAGVTLMSLPTRAKSGASSAVAAKAAPAKKKPAAKKRTPAKKK